MGDRSGLNLPLKGRKLHYKLHSMKRKLLKASKSNPLQSAIILHGTAHLKESQPKSKNSNSPKKSKLFEPQKETKSTKSEQVSKSTSSNSPLIINPISTTHQNVKSKTPTTKTQITLPLSSETSAPKAKKKKYPKRLAYLFALN